MSGDGILPSDAVDVDPSGPTDASEAAAEATEQHAAAEGADASETSGMGSTSQLREMLLSTDPSPSLAEVDSPWNPDLGGPSRIYRAFMKMGNFDGMPAALDLVIGFGETLKTVSLDEPDDQDDQDDDGLPPGLEA
ncbi:hypothetical protein EI982_09450 [Haloplanus rallus]|uniref:Uncharacterized protein n=1 Tax=Haloplanus rallus TaxID=1816183 RepID=A0A6B9FER8_9EURY|nr:hypothetical protein [Haloplanus rallus]QGX94999.1 hypothetical protein EI982_09450 [Haloplanus rallus]